MQPRFRAATMRERTMVLRPAKIGKKTASEPRPKEAVFQRGARDDRYGTATVRERLRDGL
jgi:hypothetical protein